MVGDAALVFILQTGNVFGIENTRPSDTFRGQKISC